MKMTGLSIRPELFEENLRLLEAVKAGDIWGDGGGGERG